MKPTFLPTLIPFTKEAQAVLALSPESYDGYWARKSPWISQTGEVFDQRLDLGDPRPAQPLRATEWNGTNQHAWIPIDPVTEFPFTVFGWAKIQNTNPALIPAFVGISASTGTSTYYTFRASNNALRLTRSNTSFVSNDFSLVSDNSLWYSYVVVFTSSTEAQVYRNGILVHTFTGMTAVNVGSAFNRFVASSLHAVGSTYFDGRSMHCGFLRRAATLQDAQAFHATGIIPDAEVLLPLDGNSTTVAHNIGSSAAHWLDEPRRNLLQYTERLDWVAGTGVTFGNYVDGPFPGMQAREVFGMTDTTSDSDTTNIRAASPGVNTISAVSGTTYTRSIWIRRITPGSHEAKLRLLASTFLTSEIFTITQEWQRISLTYTAGGSTTLRTILGGGGGADGVLIAGDMVELGSTATPYQPVLRTGIDYPEATIVNGAAGMLYTGRDVPFSRQNKIGFSTRRNLLPFSEDFNLWNLASQVTPNTHYGPSGQLNADTINRPGNSSYSITNTFTLIPGQQYCWSIWCRSGTNNKLTLMILNGVERPLVGTKLTGSGSVTISGGTYAQISGLDSSWSRFQVTFTAGSASSGSHQFYIYPVTSAGIGNMESGTVVIAESMVNIGNAPADPYQRIGADPGANVRFPALLSDPTKSAATDPLTFSGEVPRNAQLEQANCFTFDGSDDRVAVDLSQWAGPELVTNGTFDTNLSGWGTSGWWVWDSGRASMPSTSSYLPLTQPLNHPGKTLLVSIEVISVTGTGRLGVRNITTTLMAAQVTPAAPGIYTFVAVLNSTDEYEIIASRNTNPSSMIIDNISVRELPTGALGPELVVNGGFDTDTVWTKGTGWTISGGSANAVGSNLVLSQNSLFTSGRAYRITFTQTFTSGSLQVRIAGTQSLGFFNTSGTHVINFVATATGALEFNGTALTTSIDNVSVVQIGLIPHDGTSLLTYRPEGDGFTGTAGTAYNIRIGDVEHIPCSEGHGSVLHGTKLNQAYTVVNGQFSNWTANKQNTYHYNTAEGYGLEEGDVPTIDPLDLPGLKVYLDPEDTTRMWRDAAGTIPVTAPGQEILRITDKSDQVTFVQNTPGQGPVWGRHPVSGIVNLLTNSQALTSAGWSTLNATVTANGDMFKIVGNVGETSTELRQTYTTAELGATITISCFAREDDARYMHLGRAGAGTWFDLRTGTVLSNLAGFTGVVGPVEPDGSRRYSTSATETIANGTATQLRIYTSVNAPSSTLPTSGGGNDGTRGILINRVQRQVGALATYQTVTNRFDITEVGQPDLYYFSGNGTNQRMASLNPVDFSTTDKVTVWAGARKLSDAADGALAGLSTIASDGAWELKLPHSATANASFLSKRTTTQQAVVSGIAAPITLSLVGESDIASPFVRLTAQGTTTTVTASQGTGNYSNATLHLFSRGGSSLFFNGFCYGLVIGADNYVSSTVTEIDKLMRSKSGLVWYKDTYIPASQTNPGFDVLGNPLTNPPVVGLNGAESRINFSPVANSWPTGISIPGADIPTYEFDGNPGDIQLGINSEKREASFHLRND